VAKVKNISGEARTVPSLGGLLVLEDQVVEVPDEAADGFLVQSDVWGPVGAAAKAVKKDAEQALAELNDDNEKGDG
jgi:hypothetical protein